MASWHSREKVSEPLHCFWISLWVSSENMAWAHRNSYISISFMFRSMYALPIYQERCGIRIWWSNRFVDGVTLQLSLSGWWLTGSSSCCSGGWDWRAEERSGRRSSLRWWRNHGSCTPETSPTSWPGRYRSPLLFFCLHWSGNLKWCSSTRIQHQQETPRRWCLPLQLYHHQFILVKHHHHLKNTHN